MARRLCALADIPEDGCKGFESEANSEALFAVRSGNRLYLYRNRCPHAGTPLNWMPDRFMDRDRQHLMCATHGALFTVDKGLCIAGPCTGESLESVPFEIRKGDIWLI